MKKLVSAIMALMLLCSCLLTACGEKKKDLYIIGTDTTFVPFEMADENGNYIGIDVELLAAIAEDQGFEYELQPLGFDACLAAVTAGEIDGMIAGMSITDDRKEIYDFSEPYYESADSGVCAAAINPSIKGLDDLKGKVVAAKMGTQGYEYAEKVKDQYGFSIQTYDDSVYMYEAVKTGDCVACFEDYPVMKAVISTGEVDLKMITGPLAPTAYGFAVKKGANETLLKMFNKGLANVKSNGKLQEIFDKYLSE